MNHISDKQTHPNNKMSLEAITGYDSIKYPIKLLCNRNITLEPIYIGLCILLLSKLYL